MIDLEFDVKIYHILHYYGVKVKYWCLICPQE